MEHNGKKGKHACCKPFERHKEVEKVESDLSRLTFGELFKSARVARGLTLAGIAAQAGRNQGYLSHIERGRSAPSEEFLRSVAPFYGCPWWGPRRNRVWWVNVARIYDMLPGRRADRQLAMIGSNLENAQRIIAVIAQAAAEDASIPVMLEGLGEHLDLPGMRQLAINETMPVWAWICGSLDVDLYEKNVGATAVETAGAILTFADLSLRDVVVEVDAVVLGRRVRELREGKGWSVESLTRAVNEVRSLDPQPLWSVMETADVVEIERGGGPVALAVLEALAQALGSPLSTMLTDTPEDVPVMEEDMMDLLRESGLSEEAVASIVAHIAYWRARELDR